MARRKTAEERAWLAQRYADVPNGELLDGFRAEFGWAPTESGLASWASDMGLRKARRVVAWSRHPEYDEFLRGFIPGHGEREIIDAFETEFGVKLTESQVGNRKAALGVKSGTRGGRFEKGNVPVNKGVPRSEWGLSPESEERMRAGQFKRGDIPRGARDLPIGSERVTKDGYVEVKVRERSPVPCSNKCWELKQRVVWEREHGRELPPGWVVLFADHDKRNLDPGNLVAVPQRVNSVIQTKGLAYGDRATLTTAVRIAELKLGIARAERAPRACRRCGEVFEPRHAGQRTCDRCLDKAKRRR